MLSTNLFFNCTTASHQHIFSLLKLFNSIHHHVRIYSKNNSNEIFLNHYLHLNNPQSTSTPRFLKYFFATHQSSCMHRVTLFLIVKIYIPLSSKCGDN